MTEERPERDRGERGERTTGRPARADRAPDRAPGYRGALPPRGDALGRPWVIVVVAAFVLMFVLAFAGVPGKFFPGPSIAPIASPGASSSFNLAPSASPGS